MTTAFSAAAQRVAAAAPGLAPQAAAAFIHLPGNEPPWRPTGLRLAAGQRYTLFAAGRIDWSARHPQCHGGPRFHLWARIAPGGRIVNPGADSGTFTADVAGELELGIYMGVWADEYGALSTGPELYARLSGGLDCLALVWPAAPERGLAALAERLPELDFLRTELGRLGAPRLPPPGWSYLLETGYAEIFSGIRSEHGRPAIRIDADDDQGIITYPVDFPLTPDTELRWRWRVDTHPSAVAEDSTFTHDYLSIATEFDNGRDLTWIWSAALPAGTHFHCPIKAWTARETHYVVRSGTADMGRWWQETRRVQADVRQAMGEPPSRIVRVWLIVVSSFQHGRARAEFSDIVLAAGARTLQVL